MRTINKTFTAVVLFATILLLAGCEKDDETANVSFVTTYPTVALIGDQWEVVQVGESFTDPGIEAFEGETAIEYTTSGTVDTSVPGVYVLTYTAVNQDGFSASATRYVGVITPEAAAIDLSGQYQRNAGALGVSTVTRIEPGLYETDNIGGVADPGPSTTVRFYHYDVNSLEVPLQSVQGTTFAATDATVVPGVSYSWIVINPGYGAALRTFVKL
ncbi:immunoglobulin-like domain-containing protein [Pontibacter litorisediminis]|uniref:immunoglobulin-like domain-containing protein n=1 Tax=Pontibacter litorisediminis TaxID=1846260 RepID=UPI0023EA9307|nr:immunoglobulin-like domain-containing protein [Pontibacter litorisediminis]